MELSRPARGLRMPFRFLLAVTIMLAAGAAQATNFAPPMLDISAQCGRSFHSASAMSECVVAESEARAELLSHWGKYTDAGAQKCIMLGRKAKRQPYTAMAKCLEPETTAAAQPLATEKK